MRTEWKRGDQAQLARLALINVTHLNDIMAGRKQCRPTQAVRLELAAKTLGYDIPRSVWCFEDMRRGNPLFKKYCK